MAPVNHPVDLGFRRLHRHRPPGSGSSPRDGRTAPPTGLTGGRKPIWRARGVVGPGLTGGRKPIWRARGVVGPELAGGRKPI
ncbi:hypothetical protein [Actinoplanes regularis]|uniref:hypothetical protein n=1 Tax=Actinoplanes regularis TaxID=52697 RepID=UPI000B7750FA|nr:hypothetical protein [Actinoplanes regularis]